MYDYDLKCQLGKTHQNANALSRLFLPEEIEKPAPSGDVFLFNAFPGPPLAAFTIARMTGKDPMLPQLYSALQAGTVEPLRGDDDFRAHVQRGSEFSISHGCMIWGNCLVVPVAARAQAMMLVHAGHRGGVSMRNLLVVASD